MAIENSDSLSNELRIQLRKRKTVGMIERNYTESSEGNDLEEFEVENIVDACIFRQKINYLVHWKGYDSDEDTWETEENLAGAKLLLKEFKKQNAEKVKILKEELETQIGRKHRSKRRSTIQAFLGGDVCEADRDSLWSEDALLVEIVSSRDSSGAVDRLVATQMQETNNLNPKKEIPFAEERNYPISEHVPAVAVNIFIRGLNMCNDGVVQIIYTNDESDVIKYCTFDEMFSMNAYGLAQYLFKRAVYTSKFVKYSTACTMTSEIMR